MGLKVTVDRPVPGHWSERVDVDAVIDDNTIEFPGYDLDADLAARELGFEDANARLLLYDEYKRSGFRGLVESDSEQIYDALEEQGYDVFEYYDEPFSAERFAELLIDNITANKGYIVDEIAVLEGFVDFNETDAGTVSQGDYIDAMIKTLQKLFADNDSSIDEVAEAVRPALDEEDIVYSVDDRPIMGEDYQNIVYYEHAFEILGETIATWETGVESEIVNPVNFYVDVTDLAEYDSELGTPDAAHALLSAFGREEAETDDPPEPAHPESDPDGKFAVLYEKYDTMWVRGKGSVRTDDIEETIVMPYADWSDADSAVDLSESILSNSGELKDWDIRILRAKTDEELRDQELERRQLSLLDEQPWDDDPEWMDEWALYDTEE